MSKDSVEHTGWTARTSVQLVADQLRAIDAWNQARLSVDGALAGAAVTREMRQDLTRGLESRRRTQQAVLQRTTEHLRRSGALPITFSSCRAVLVHRNAWLREKVATGLRECGVEIAASLEDGADGVGALIAEQPDLVLIEDRLPSVSGLEVVLAARRYAGGCLVAAQLLDATERDAFVQAGADAVFTRKSPPSDIVAALLSPVVSAARQLDLDGAAGAVVA